MQTVSDDDVRKRLLEKPRFFIFKHCQQNLFFTSTSSSQSSGAAGASAVYAEMTRKLK